MPIKARDGRFEPMILEMQLKVQNAVDSKKKIVWLDEVMFTKSTNLKCEWSKRRQNFRIPTEALGGKYTAVLTAISEGCGFEYTELYDEALN